MTSDERTGSSEASPVIEGRLGVWDVVSLIVGIVVGVSIFRVPGIVFSSSGSPAMGLFIWFAGGVLALSGALCYSELSATYPRFGAEYIFLGKAYSSRVAFLFGWMQTFAVIPGSIGAMAFVFAAYAGSIFPSILPAGGLIAAGSIAVLTLVQLCGFQVGRIVQHLLTGIKVLSLVAVLISGWMAPSTSDSVQIETVPAENPWGGIGLALVFVLYAYGGWNDVAAVTPEVRDCRKNIPRGLILGLLLICLLYVLLNLSFLRGLGFAGVCESRAPVADVVRKMWGPGFSNAMSLIVMASALGAMHATMFAGCRMLAAIGEDFPMFQKWNVWSTSQVPVPALLTISGMSLLLTLIVGTVNGHLVTDSLMKLFQLPVPQWEKFEDGFEVLVTASAPVFWGFFFLSGLSLIVLRWKDPHVPRPFRVPFYPLTPIVFSLAAGYMFWSSANYAGKLTLLMLPLLLCGLVLAMVLPVRDTGKRKRAETD